jgi:hypothetical protein
LEQTGKSITGIADRSVVDSHQETIAPRGEGWRLGGLTSVKAGGVKFDRVIDAMHHLRD